MKSASGTPTINDVARLASISKRTVSRVLNGSAKVNETTRKEIERIIKELNYKPSPQARGLANRRSYMIGLLYDDPNWLFVEASQRGILDVSINAGYELMVHPCEYMSDNLIGSIVHFVTRSNVDGVVILPPLSANVPLIEELRKQNYPYVRLAAKMLDDTGHIMVSEDRAAMHELADHLASLGHHNIAFIGGPKDRIAGEERLEGFRVALATHNFDLKSNYIVTGDFTFESGIECGRKLLLEKPRPTAIFAANDEMAVGVLHAAHQLGIKIPQQLSVAGYDDSQLASRCIPLLTTFQRQDSKLAAMAARKLISQISGQPADSEQLETVMRPRLIIRESTGPCPA